MARPRRMVITIDFHFTREKRGTSGEGKLVMEKIVRYIRRRIEPFVVIDSITYERKDPEE